MDIIFLDIDGVLNCQSYFFKNHDKILNLYADHVEERYKNSASFRVDRLMMDIDRDKLNILKNIIEDTGAKIIVVSSWKSLDSFDGLVKRLKAEGIPIIGKTVDNLYNRGAGIYQYLNTHNVDNYVILDDEVFSDYDKTLCDHLVKTSFYEDGLTKQHAEKAKIMLKSKIKR